MKPKLENHRHFFLLLHHPGSESWIAFHLLSEKVTNLSPTAI